MSNQLSNGLLARRRRVNENPPLPDPTLTRGGNTTSTAGGTVYNITFSNLGDDYVNRYVVFAVNWSAATTLLSVTVGDVAAKQISSLVSGSRQQAIFIARVPTGTSAAAALTFSATPNGYSCAWDVVTDLKSTDPVAEGSASGTNNPAVNVSIPAQGVVYAYWRAVYGVSPGSTNWSSPMTSLFSQNIFTQQRHSAAYRIAATDIASYNVTNSFNYSDTWLNVVVLR